MGELTMKSPVVMSSTLVSSVFRINLNTRPISFLDTLETAHISEVKKKQNHFQRQSSENVSNQKSEILPSSF